MNLCHAPESALERERLVKVLRWTCTWCAWLMPLGPAGPSWAQLDAQETVGSMGGFSLGTSQPETIVFFTTKNRRFPV